MGSRQCGLFSLNHLLTNLQLPLVSGPKTHTLPISGALDAVFKILLPLATHKTLPHVILVDTELTPGDQQGVCVPISQSRKQTQRSRVCLSQGKHGPQTLEFIQSTDLL